MAGMTDEHHLVVGLLMAHHFHVHLGHQGTSGIKHPEPPFCGLIAHRLRHAMGAKDHRTIVRHIVQLIDKHRPLIAQAIHHEAVMHHLVAHIDRGTELLQSAFHDIDGTIDAGAKAARVG